MLRNVILATMVLGAWLGHCCRAHGSVKCLPCSEDASLRRQQCGRQARNCPSSLVPDVCKCCWTCAKAEHQFCGGLWHMHGRCERGLRCEATEQQLESVVIATTRDATGMQQSTPHVLANGLCKGTGRPTPCQETKCPNNTTCYHSYLHCGEFPASNHMSHCVPVAKCVAGSADCVKQLYSGCDQLNGQCWCGERAACREQPAFQFPSRHSCERHRAASTLQEGNGETGTDAGVTVYTGSVAQTQVPIHSVAAEDASSCRLDNGTTVVAGTSWSTSPCNSCNCSADGIVVCDETWGRNCPQIGPNCVARELSMDECCVICKDVPTTDTSVLKEETNTLTYEGEEGKDLSSEDLVVKQKSSISKQLVWPIIVGCVGFATLVVLLVIVWKRYRASARDRSSKRIPRGNFAYSPASAEQQHLHALLQCRNFY